MVNKDGGNAGGDAVPAGLLVHKSPSERHAQHHLITPGAGEIIISISDIARVHRDPQNTGQPNRDGEPILSKAAPVKWPFATLSKTRLLGRKLQTLRRKRHGVARSAAGREAAARKRGWWSKFYADTPLSLGSELLLIFLIFIGLSALVFFVCIATTKIALEGCGWSICFRIRHGLSHGRHHHPLAKVPIESYVSRSDCVFRRYVPHLHFPFLEIIHDLKSGQSALVEWRGGLRCMLFDMRRYAPPPSAACPASYPTSMDERLGVPAPRSQLTMLFPRRFARHQFSYVELDPESLARVAGPAIARRCSAAHLAVALVVDVRVESRQCQATGQLLVDNLLALSDPSYRRSRSREMSDAISGTVVLYENWDPSAAVVGTLVGASQTNSSGNNGAAAIGEEVRSQLAETKPQQKSEMVEEPASRDVLSPSSGARVGTIVKNETPGELTNIVPLAKREAGSKVTENSPRKDLRTTFTRLKRREERNVARAINLLMFGNSETGRERRQTHHGGSLQSHFPPNKIDSERPGLEEKSADAAKKKNSGKSDARIQGKDSNKKTLAPLERHQPAGEYDPGLLTISDMGMEIIFDFVDKDSLPKKNQPLVTLMPPVGDKKSPGDHGTAGNARLNTEEGSSETVWEKPHERAVGKTAVVIASKNKEDGDKVKLAGKPKPSWADIGQNVGDDNENLRREDSNRVALGESEDKAVGKRNNGRGRVADGERRGSDGISKQEVSALPDAENDVSAVRQSGVRAPARHPAKREAVGLAQAQPGLALVHPPQQPEPADGSTLLSLVQGPVIRVTAGSTGVKGHNRAAPPLLKGVSVETEVRRYFLWMGRIIRACQLVQMPRPLA